jgi:signal transduction histidine kinase
VTQDPVIVAGVVSHDLRNPLAAATAAAELARYGDDEEVLDRAADAHRRMDDLIEGLLSLATAGKSVDSLDRDSIDGAARRGWSRLETADATLSGSGSDD